MKWFGLHKSRKILFLYSFPPTKEFLECESELKKCVEALGKYGVEVHSEISRKLLEKSNAFDVVIIVAHRDDEHDALALSNGIATIDEFVSWIPESFDGVIDFSSCYGVKAVERIKKRCPQSHVQFSVNQVHLKLRLAMYPYVVNYFINNKKISYNDACNQVLEAFKEHITISSDSSDETKLANHDQHLSSVYAPQAVKKEESFRVQIFFYKKGETERVEMQAKRSDPASGKIETQILPIRLKKKDILTVQITFLSPQKEWIELDEDTDTKQCIWNGISTHFQFAAIVKEQFSKEKFDTRIKMEVNGMPVGECYFTIQIAEERKGVPADYDVIPHDFAHEQNKEQETLLKKLTLAQENLKERIRNSIDDIEREKLEKDLQVNEMCLKYYTQSYRSHHNDTKHIFISSTSDLKPYREILRGIVEKKNLLYAEMYEKWPQKDCTPRDECCRKVLESDIVMCLLGANYGSEEPCLGMSMTEIEFRTALKMGKPLLVFILDPLNESKETPPKPERQRELIQELRDKRIVRLFSSKKALKESAKDDLNDMLVKIAGGQYSYTNH